jgi:hypothetical protein
LEDSVSIFSDYAWSEKGGYISMNDSGSVYGVQTDWLE